MKKHYWIILIILIAGSIWLIIKTGDLEPRFSETIDLNWRFILGDDSTYYKPDTDDSKWEIVSLPHDWMIKEAVDQDNPSGMAGAFYPGGIAWYRKYLDLSNLEDKEQFYLIFDGVYMNADVWINGKHLGRHNYGYIGFNFDISDYIHKDSLNIIAVRTDCSEMPVDRWYSGAGIYRHVKLIATDKLHFPENSTSIFTQKTGDGHSATSSISIRNNARRTKRFKVKTELISPDGRLVGTVVSSKSLSAGETLSLEEKFLISEAMLWSPNEPNLYEMRTYLYDKKMVSDNIISKFGVRDIQFSPDSGFILNGRKEWLKGVCLHSDGGELGAAVPDVTWEYRLSGLKELGVNALRLAHNPHSPEVLDLCDRMGFLVINEMYDKWEEGWPGSKGSFDFVHTYEQDLSYFVKRDINHPSVILWSVGNETQEQLNDPQAGVEWYSKLASIVSTLDSSRMVSCGLHPGYERDGIEIPSSYIHVSPAVSYNYRTDSFPSWHSQYPELIWIASETKVYNEERRNNFENIDYSDNSWLDMDTFIAGQFIWSGIDYLGETMGWPDRIFRNGLLKTNGEIKPYAYYTQSIYSEEPMVRIVLLDNEMADSLNRSNSWQKRWAGAPVVRHWNLMDQPGEHTLILYTNCKKVDILLNDSIINTLYKSDFPDGVLKSSVVYEPGNIKAIAYNDINVQAAVDSILTALPPARIMMEPDKTRLIANGSDVMHIQTRVTDSIGTTHPHADHIINYTLDGPGNIMVIDNGDPGDHSVYGANSKRVINGSHLVIIQSSLAPGDLTISATAEGLESALLNVQSVPEK